jgi:GT2 family glycosyltransferase
MTGSHAGSARSGAGPHVAVVIVGFRNPGDIATCLAALERSVWHDFHVVIVENGGAAAFEALCAAIPDALAGGQRVEKIASPGNVGFAGGVNAGIEASRDAGAWWVLNPDTEPEPNALCAMVERLSAGDCDAVGSVLYGATGRVQAYGGHWQVWLARSVSIGIGKPIEAAIDAPAVERRQNYLLGASMLVSPRFLDVVGLMREDYFLYCEEAEWCLRALSRGLRLGFAPGARVLHRQGATTGAGGVVRRQPVLPVYLGERNRILLSRDAFPAQAPISCCLALGTIALRYPRRGAWRQFAVAVAGWWHGVLGRRGRPAWVAG